MPHLGTLDVPVTWPLAQTQHQSQVFLSTLPRPGVKYYTHLNELYNL